MRYFKIEDRTKYNPMVADKITLVFDSIQEEICGFIESVVGAGQLKPEPQLASSIYKKDLDTSFQLSSWKLPDPSKYFAGFYDYWVTKCWKGPDGRSWTFIDKVEIFVYYQGSDPKGWKVVSEKGRAISKDAPVDKLKYDSICIKIDNVRLFRVP